MTSLATDLHGVLPVLHTPFTVDYAIDVLTLEREVDWAFKTGADGVVCAMVSETLRLGYHGRKELATHVCGAGKGRGFVVISVGAESIAEAREISVEKTRPVPEHPANPTLRLAA